MIQLIGLNPDTGEVERVVNYTTPFDQQVSENEEKLEECISCGEGLPEGACSRSETKCTHCGTESTRHPPGDGCHACSLGYMKKVEDHYEK